MGLEYTNDIDKANSDNGIKCPLVDFEIKKETCLENTMIIAGFIDEISMNNKFKEKDNWHEICQNCKYFNF